MRDEKRAKTQKEIETKKFKASFSGCQIFFFLKNKLE